MIAADWCAPLRPGLVAGLRAEARLARRLGAAEGGGGTPAGAAAAAERLIAAGASALISFGLCGGLDPALPAGALVVPRRVLAGDTVFAADAELSAALGGWSATTLLAADTPVASAAAKRHLFVGTGAAGVDLESGAVARVAARHAVPFAALRAVCDAAEIDLPPLALCALTADGRLRPWRMAAALAVQPDQMRALIALARAAAAARAALIGRIGDILRRRGTMA